MLLLSQALWYTEHFVITAELIGGHVYAVDRRFCTAVMWDIFC